MSPLATVLLTLVLVQQPSPSELRAEAERLARAGNHAEALKRFQVLTAANPDDVETRLWIGRLHMAMNHPARAAAVYESIVATSPQNVDALAGLAEAQMALGRWNDAAASLARAEKLAPERIDVLAAQGRYHGANHRTTLALAYYDRALAAEPGNERIREAADALRATRAHRVEAGYDLQAARPGGNETHGGSIEVNARVADLLRVFGRGQLFDFSDGTDKRGGGGVEVFAHRDVRIRAGGLFGDTLWLASSDVFVDLEVSHRRARWTGRFRTFDFDGASFWVAGPGVAVDVTPKVTVRAEYLRGSATFDGQDSIGSNNATFGVDGRVTPRLMVSGEYRRGIEYLDWLTIDRIFRDDANTFSIGGKYAVNPLTHLSLRYEHHDKPEDLTTHRIRAWLFVGF